MLFFKFPFSIKLLLRFFHVLFDLFPCVDDCSRVSARRKTVSRREHLAHVELLGDSCGIWTPFRDNDLRVQQQPTCLGVKCAAALRRLTVEEEESGAFVVIDVDSNTM